MAALFRQPRAICQCQRSFSTSTPRSVSLQWDKNDSDALAEVLPPYPYGPARWYKQSNRGLYGGQRKQFGNNVSGDFDTKTRRTWKPNVFTRKLFSKALNRYVQIRVSSRVLRTIDKLGGLDEYLLGEKEARIKELGVSGWWLRWAILQTPKVKARFAAEREALGLPADADQLSAVEEALSEPGEDGEADTEAVAMDATFQVEHNPDLPPIKFRVGPRQHVMLTADGWVRTRPDPDRWTNMAKKKLQEENFPEWFERRSAVLRAHLQTRLTNGEISQPEADSIRKNINKQLRAELQAKVEKMYNRQTKYRHIVALRKKEAKRAQAKLGESEELKLEA